MEDPEGDAQKQTFPPKKLEFWNLMEEIVEEIW